VPLLPSLGASEGEEKVGLSKLSPLSSPLYPDINNVLVGLAAPHLLRCTPPAPAPKNWSRKKWLRLRLYLIYNCSGVEISFLCFLPLLF
jgi:hypothetical protein